LALRLLPKSVVQTAFNAVLDGLVGDLLAKCTMLWGLVPAEDYDTAAGLWLSDPAMAEIKEQTDRFQKARLHSRTNILKLKQKGAQVYVISEYNTALPAIVRSWSEVNADGVIDSASTSLGAVFGYVDTPLPAGYAPENTAYLSPDGIVDASAAALPAYTWFFKNQTHSSTGRSQPVLSLVGRLVSGADYVTVKDLPDFPQFIDVGAATPKTYTADEVFWNEAAAWLDSAVNDAFGANGYLDWLVFWA